MIFWLTQSWRDLPQVELELVPPAYLSVSEEARWQALRSEKRRRDWLLGRWTAKLLLQAAIQEQSGELPTLSDLAIASRPDGAPCLDWPTARNGSMVTLSLSHSGEYAACAAAFSPGLGGAGVNLGIDIEKVEPRSPRFAADYFTPAEAALVERTPGEGRDVLVTAIWSAKEAALKAKQLGLRVDTRSVACRIELPDKLPGRLPDHWLPFEVEWDAVRLRSSGFPFTGILPTRGWCRFQAGYIITLVAQSPLVPHHDPLRPVAPGRPCQGYQILAGSSPYRPT